MRCSHAILRDDIDDDVCYRPATHIGLVGGVIALNFANCGHNVQEFDPLCYCPMEPFGLCFKHAAGWAKTARRRWSPSRVTSGAGSVIRIKPLTV